jgi:hypothetical protein
MQFWVWDWRISQAGIIVKGSFDYSAHLFQAKDLYFLRIHVLIHET